MQTLKGDPARGPTTEELQTLLDGPVLMKLWDLVHQHPGLVKRGLRLSMDNERIHARAVFGQEQLPEDPLMASWGRAEPKLPAHSPDMSVWFNGGDWADAELRK